MKSRRITLFAGLLTGVCSILLLTTAPSLAVTMNNWTGDTNDDWTVSGNWSVQYLNDSGYAALFGPISNGNTTPSINSAVGFVAGYIEFQAGAPTYNITDSGGTCRLYIGISGPSAGILVDAGVTNSQTISTTYLFFENPATYYITNNSTTPGATLNIDASLGGHYASSLSGTWVVNGSNNTNISGTIFDNNSSVATTELDKEGADACDCQAHCRARQDAPGADARHAPWGTMSTAFMTGSARPKDARRCGLPQRDEKARRP